VRDYKVSGSNSYSKLVARYQQDLLALQEFDPGLMARLERNFANARNVRVVQGDGTRVAFDPAQLIYVNAGATRPADRLQAPPGCYRERYSRLTRCWRRLPDLSQEVAPAFPLPRSSP
jgi:hypothetical protein